jgi:hypothetical protein
MTEKLEMKNKLADEAYQRSNSTEDGSKLSTLLILMDAQLCWLISFGPRLTVSRDSILSPPIDKR